MFLLCLVLALINPVYLILIEKTNTAAILVIVYT